jgi:hypothetical protein
MAKKKSATNFVGEFYRLQRKAVKHITRLVKENKNVILYCEPSSEDEEDMIYDAPRLTYINKHGEYIGYGVVELTLEDGKVSIRAKSVDLDKDYEVFTLSDMMAEETIFLADAIDNVFRR